ncbi:MAG: VOC family protein [Candidatus Marsarchaeota archaeon]|jgi:predicted enzyme related to lactoylglutathione lyase|nr:VOC family protein [Candidatus Marsarchaeota archaeon]
MRLAQNNIIVELHVPDFGKVKTFYKKLGFKVAWERKPSGLKGYLVMKRGDNVLCFWPGNKDVGRHPYFSSWAKSTKRGYGVELVLMVKDVKSEYARVKKFAKVVEELKLKPWGLYDFRIEDPFGYYIRITAPYNTLDDSNAVP